MARKKPSPKPRPSRLTLEIPARARERLDALSDATDQSLAEVVRRALALYGVLWDEAKRGGTLVIRDAGGKEREIVVAEFRD